MPRVWHDLRRRPEAAPHVPAPLRPRLRVRPPPTSTGRLRRKPATSLPAASSGVAGGSCAHGRGPGVFSLVVAPPPAPDPRSRRDKSHWRLCAEKVPEADNGIGECLCEPHPCLELVEALRARGVDRPV